MQIQEAHAQWHGRVQACQHSCSAAPLSGMYGMQDTVQIHSHGHLTTQHLTMHDLTSNTGTFTWASPFSSLAKGKAHESNTDRHVHHISGLHPRSNLLLARSGWLPTWSALGARSLFMNPVLGLHPRPNLLQAWSRWLPQHPSATPMTYTCGAPHVVHA
eukprot:1162025-Pelagomonas_calceolata.AAC.6